MWNDDFVVICLAWRTGDGRQVECWWPFAGIAFGVVGALAIGFGYPRKLDWVVSQLMDCCCCRRSRANDDTLRLDMALLVVGAMSE